MKYLGLLILSAMFMLAVCFFGSRDKNAKELIGIFIVGTILFFLWAVGVYWGLHMLIMG